MFFNFFALTFLAFVSAGANKPGTNITSVAQFNMTTLLTQINLNWNNYELSIGNPNKIVRILNSATVAIAVKICSIESGASNFSETDLTPYVFMEHTIWLDTSGTASSLVAANKLLELSGYNENHHLYDFMSSYEINGVGTHMGFAICSNGYDLGKYWVAVFSMRK